MIDDGSISIHERPDPTPAPGWVLIENLSAGLNAADLLQRRGHYPAPPGWPQDIPGMEFAGRVSQLGDGVSEVWLGKTVCGLVGGGAQSTHLCVPVAHVMEVPESASIDEAGGFSEAFVVAHDALVSVTGLRATEHLVISGASGGVGTAAVQVGRLLGARVTAVTRHHDHVAALHELGADQVITPDEVPGLDDVDVVLELVGAANLDVVQSRLAPGARVVVIGVAGGGSKSTVNLLGLMSTRATLTGTTMRSRSADEKAAAISAAAATLCGPWAEGRLRVPVARRFLLDEAAAAYDYFSRPGKFGKVILRVNES